MDNKIKYTLKLENNHNISWTITDKYAVKGFGFIEDILYQGEELGSLIKKAWDSHKVDGILNKLNGNFSCILIYGDEIILISDKIRSYPLIFSILNNNSYIISDCQGGILKSIENEKSLVRTNEVEILSLGYVSGNETLYEDTKTVGAGEYVYLKNNMSFEFHKYHCYIYPKIYTNVWEAESLRKFYDKVQSALEEGFKRILKTIPQSSKIVLPLSGGYDSRLIACLCKKFGCKNVLCYTYGRKSSFEVEISKMVADTLNFEWHFVEYEPQNFTNTILSNDFGMYNDFTENLNSIPHVQEFLALKILIGKRIISPGDIVIPGFCGDLFGGSKIPREVYEWSNDKFDIKNLTKVIYNHFYDLNEPCKKDMKIILGKLRYQFVNCQDDIHNIENFVDLYENWCIDNRLAKFIINSVRVYEYFGLGWRLPLWDDEYSHNWYEMSWRLKSPEILNKFMFERYFNDYNVNIKKSNSGAKNKRINNIKRTLINIFGVRFVRKLTRYLIKHDDYNCFEETAMKLSCRLKSTIPLSKQDCKSINAVLAILMINKFNVN